jgi:hypothetical protein
MALLSMAYLRHFLNGGPYPLQSLPLDVVILPVVGHPDVAGRADADVDLQLCGSR